MIQLKENRGIPRSILLMMAIIAGLTELIRHDLGITEQSANLITVITQIGYALGLFFLIPLGDMFSRKKLILANMTIAAVMAIVMAVAQNVWMLWGASLLIGACSVIPQFFIPIAGQFSEPKNKSRNMGIVLSGLLASNQRLHRRMAGMAGDVFHCRLRHDCLHGRDAIDDARDEAQLCGYL